MKKWLGLIGLLLGLSAVSYAGTPQETLFLGQSPLSQTTIIGSTASVTSAVNLILNVSTPTAFNSGGGTYQGRNCFTRFMVQIPTTTVVTIVDNGVTKWTLYGLGLGASGVNTLSIPEAHLEPFCTAAGDATVINLTNTAGSAVPQSFNYEGYTTYGGTNNGGPMQ